MLKHLAFILQPSISKLRNRRRFFHLEMKLYIGRLPTTVRSVEIEDLFGKYGRLVSVELKDGGYGYVEFGEEWNGRRPLWLW